MRSHAIGYKVTARSCNLVAKGASWSSSCTGLSPRKEFRGRFLDVLGGSHYVLLHFEPKLVNIFICCGKNFIRVRFDQLGEGLSIRFTDSW